MMTQNLSDGRQSIFWNGRAWFKLFTRKFRSEWTFGRKASGLSIKLEFGEGDSDADVCFHVCIPWICSLFFIVENVWRTKSFWTGFYIYEGMAYCISLAAFTNDSSQSDRWWRKTLYEDFPWALAWHCTEVLKENGLVHEVVWREDRNSRRGRDSFDVMREQESAEKTVQSKWPYKYTLKDGTVQGVEATIHLERREWRARWWPIIPIKKSRTSIDVAFSSEVGEGTGSWKGGTVGCGYDLLPNETAAECLKRMERDRKFDQ